MTTRTLDRLYELDWRSLAYPVAAKVPEYRPRSYTWSIDAWLDQGYEGACVGFSFAHDLVARPQVVRGVSNEGARQIYLRAQRIDEWPGEDYEGTSVLAGAKICTEDGYFSGYTWAVSIEELALGIMYFGPCVLGLNWYRGMSDPDSRGFIHPLGVLDGGHAILANAIKIIYKPLTFLWFWRSRTWADVDLDRSYLTLHNSWGRDWGDDGKCKLSLRDLDRLLHENGDACFPVRTTKTD